MQYHKLKLMPEFECWCIWNNTDELVDENYNINPSDLAISHRLIADLNDWTECWDRQYDRQVPLNSGFKDAEEAARFNARGRELLEQLKLEMPDAEWTLRLPQ